MKKTPDCTTCPKPCGSFRRECPDEKTGRSTGDVARAFLAYSFKDIGFKYSDLTDTEKALCTPQEWAKLVAWVKDPFAS